jgi:hypothetical protein
MIRSLSLTRQSSLMLAISIAATVVVALSIHVVMLQVLWVPYPDAAGVGRLGMLYPLAQSLGLVWFAAASLPWLKRFRPIVRGLIVGLLFATMNGIIRNALMAGFATTDFGGSVASFVQQVLFDLILGAIAVLAVSLTRDIAPRIVAALVIAAAGTFLFNPALESLLAPLISWSARHVRPDVYLPPYGPNVLVPSYLLFAETVIACLVTRFVTVFRQVGWDQTGLIRYVGLVLLVRGTWVMMLVWGPIIGMLSVSQFFFQDLVMALMIHVTWHRFGKPASPH